MSLETVLQAHTDALNNLAEAIRASGGAVGAAIETGDQAEATDRAEPAPGPFYWEHAESGSCGQVDTADELKALLADEDYAGAQEISKSRYEKLHAEAEKAEKAAKAAEEKKAKAAKAAEEKKAKAAKAAEEKKAKGTKKDTHPTEDELIEAFREFLPQSLTKEERAERHKLVKPMLASVGATRATELKPEHRAAAIDAVKRVMAGEEVDPESVFAAEEADGDSDSEDDLV